MSSFKRSITHGVYVSPVRVQGAWPERVISTKVEKHMPKPVPADKRKQAKLIVRKQDGSRYVIA